MTDETMYVIAMDDDEGFSECLHPTDAMTAIADAKRIAARTGCRVNLYKLVQSHTFAPRACDMCGTPFVDLEASSE